MKKIEKSIEMNAKYIISYFNEKNIDVTNLKLQKLLYFLEAIYMVLEDANSLFDEDFYAWDFGPVNDKIYQIYKYYGNFPISLDEKININPNNKKYIEELFRNFSEFKAFELVSISHQEGSPWSEINKKYNSNIPDGIKIEKIATKKWFNTIIEINNEEDYAK